LGNVPGCAWVGADPAIVAKTSPADRIESDFIGFIDCSFLLEVKDTGVEGPPLFGPRSRRMTLIQRPFNKCCDEEPLFWA
jgi:hypothetical protein